jgi:hypothetical protein
MKPVIQIWIREKSLDTIARGHYPSSWWRQCPSDIDAICITVSSDWFRQMRDYEDQLDKDSQMPF